MSYATLVQQGRAVEFTADAAYSGGDVFQIRDGRAGVVVTDVESGKLGAAQVGGIYEVAKAAGVALLAGGKAFWDHSANKATFRKSNDRDFYLGSVVEDAAEAATTVRVALNEKPCYAIRLDRDGFVSALVGASTPQPLMRGGALRLQVLDTIVEEAPEDQKVDALSKAAFAVAANAIVELVIDVQDGGDAAALLAHIGVANGTDSDDFTDITEYVAVALVGASDAISIASAGDAETIVAAADSGENYSAGVPFEVWFDLRDPSNVGVYIDGALIEIAETTFDISAAAGPLKLIAHMLKASDDTTGTIDVNFAGVRIAQQ